jgi:phage host-nuclease inhibitor protein Gam
MAIDTLGMAKRLHEAGFTDPQAEAVVAAVQEGTIGTDLASKGDLDAVRTALKAEIAALRAELRAEIAALRAELRAEIAALRAELKAHIREAELRLEAKIEAIKSDILNRVFGLILGALVVNIVAMVGAVFAVAKPVGH